MEYGNTKTPLICAKHSVFFKDTAVKARDVARNYLNLNFISLFCFGPSAEKILFFFVFVFVSPLLQCY